MADPRPWLSGFCNPSNPPESHDRCKGSTGGKGGTVLVCSCPHHKAAAHEPTTGDQPSRPAGIASMSIAELQASIAAATGTEVPT